MIGRGGTISPIGCWEVVVDCLGFVGAGSDLMDIAVEVGAGLIDAHVVGVAAREWGVSTVDGNTVDVLSPTPGHGGTGPPRVGIGVNPQQPPCRVMMKMKIRIQGLRQDKQKQRHGNLYQLE